MGKLEGKVAIVTGSSRGIGRAIALAFAQEGAKVVVNYLTSEAEAEEVVREIEALGSEAIAIRADVSESDEVKALIKRALERFGRIDILVNNAGIYLPYSLQSEDETNWDRMMAVNVKGVLLCSKYAAPHMLKQGHGVIINMAAQIGFLGFIGYGLTKGAVISLTKGLARELAPKIRVNAIAPGAVDTGWVSALSDGEKKKLAEEIPLKKWAQPEDVAKVAVFLASDDSHLMTGTVLVMDGGDLIEVPHRLR
jgi:3-oxoacyl-[acyl-carrier protein] reductase